MYRLLQHIVKNQARLFRDRIILEKIAAQNEGCRIDARAIIRLGPGYQLRLGKDVIIGALTLLSLEADPNAPNGQGAVLEIGDSTYIGEMNNLRADHGIRIGTKCLISQGVSIISSNHSTTLGVAATDQPARTDRAGVTIEDDVWVGTNSTILPGVTIGTGAIVAAGSVVTTAVLPNTIVGGVPARFIKHRQ
jgi:acetyltransferase-like isoleucine patch superfamily enzyme